MITKEEFLQKAKQAAMNIGQQWPGYVAAEAALESAWGASQLYLKGNNAFGMKQHVVAVYETLDLPTKEYVNGQWITAVAHWVKYPDIETCFRDRQATLLRLAPMIKNYELALAASSGEDFVRFVSLSWSTDPERGQKVMDIYNAHPEVLA